MMGKDEATEGCSNSVAVVHNHDDMGKLIMHNDDLLSSAVRPQAPAGDNTYGQTAASSGKEAEDSEQEGGGAETQSKHKPYPLPCRICLGVDLEGCEPASLMPHAAMQSLQEEGHDLWHFMACGPHCARPAGECATNPTQLRCGCRGGMAVAHYVCALGWLAKRKTHECEICGQIVANIRAVDITLFIQSNKEKSGNNITNNDSHHHNQLPPAEAANHLDVNNNATDNAQPNHASPSCSKAGGILALFCVLFIMWEGLSFTLAGKLFRCWSVLHEPKKAIIVTASLLGLHIIALPIMLCLRCDKTRVALWWLITPVYLVLLLTIITAALA